MSLNIHSVNHIWGELGHYVGQTGTTEKKDYIYMPVDCNNKTNLMIVPFLFISKQKDIMVDCWLF